MLYALDEFYPVKQQKSIEIIAQNPTFCSQNLSEFANVCLRKWKMPKSKVSELLKMYIEQCEYVPLSNHMLLRSLDLVKSYDFQLFDAMVVSSALESGCQVLYSEDMHHNLLIDKQLKILNPFVN